MTFDRGIVFCVIARPFQTRMCFITFRKHDLRLISHLKADAKKPETVPGWNLPVLRESISMYLTSTTKLKEPSCFSPTHSQWGILPIKRFP